MLIDLANEHLTSYEGAIAIDCLRLLTVLVEDNVTNKVNFLEACPDPRRISSGKMDPCTNSVS